MLFTLLRQNGQSDLAAKLRFRETPPRIYPLKLIVVPALVNQFRRLFRQQIVKRKPARAKSRAGISICLIVGFVFSQASLLSAQALSDRPINNQHPSNQVGQPPPHRPAAQISTTRISPDRRLNRAPVKPHAATKELALIREIIEPEILMSIEPTQSKIIRTNYPIVRSAISDPGVVDIQTFGSNEFEIIGKGIGETSLTFWYELPNGQIDYLRYLVEVSDEGQKQKKKERRYLKLQSRINEAFPNSQVFLIPIEDKVIVRGQARDAKEALDIMQMLGQSGGGGRGGGFGNSGGGQLAFGGNVNGGNPAWLGNSRSGRSGGNSNGQNEPPEDYEEVSPRNFINLLKVPGVQQVMLKVRIAELVRNSNRSVGTDITALFDNGSFSHLLGGSGGNVSAILSDGDVQFFLTAVGTHGYGKILAEPTLVTISGKSARFQAGGEFAVPTTVGVGGVGGIATTFRGFGTELNFTPTVVDKDLIRLEVSPSFSTLNNDATVAGIPGLNRRSVDTTVDLREGQWLAVAGLIQDEQGGQKTRLPYVGDLPFLGGFFSQRDTSRFETELIVLVSPELIHPLEPEQVPLLLPGMEITDPTDDDFFLRRQTEGYRGFDHRSTLWTEIQTHQRGIREAQFLDQVTSGARRQMQVQQSYISGPCGLSE